MNLTDALAEANRKSEITSRLEIDHWNYQAPLCSIAVNGTRRQQLPAIWYWFYQNCGPFQICYSHCTVCMCVHVCFSPAERLKPQNIVFLHCGRLLTVPWPPWRRGVCNFWLISRLQSEEKKDFLFRICWWGGAMESNTLAGDLYS